MSAAISVLAADETGSAAVLHGTFDSENQWFLTKHLGELDGDVTIDCGGVESLAPASLEALRQFYRQAAAEGRRVVIQSLSPDGWFSLRNAS